MTGLKKILDDFKADYSDLDISVQSIALDGGVVRQRHFRDGGAMFLVYGAPLAEVYVLDKKGKPRVKPYDNTLLALGLLSTGDTSSTMFHEFRKPIKKGVRQVNGFTADDVAGLEGNIRMTWKDWNPNNDSAFLFGGHYFVSLPKAALVNYWLRSIIGEGSKMLAPDYMSRMEHSLMGAAIAQDVLLGDENTIRNASHHYGTHLWFPESTEFLQKKIDAWRRFGLKNSTPYSAATNTWAKHHNYKRA